MIKRKIPFNIVFAFLFLSLLIGNFTYKTIIYFSSDKYEGKIIGFNMINNVNNPDVIPTIEFKDENAFTYRVENYKWSYFVNKGYDAKYRNDLNKKVTVLKNVFSNDYEYITFFNYWITLYDIIIAFLILFFGVIFYEITQNLIRAICNKFS